MLAHLRIRDFVLIDELDLELSPGFNVLTGETGAGKSLIATAVNLLLGRRGATDLVRRGADEAEIEGLFDISDEPGVKARLAGAGLPDDDELCVRRVIPAKGRHRCYVNGRLASLSMLSEMAEGLARLMGQHEHHALTDPARQLELTDGFGGLEPKVRHFVELYEKSREAERELDELMARKQDRAARLDYLSFQLEEIKKVDPEEGELDQLKRELERLKHLEQLTGAATRGAEILYESDGSVFDRLGQVAANIEDGARHDAELEPCARQLNEASALIEDGARFLAGYSRGLDADPARLEDLDERREELERLTRKHGTDLAGVIALAEEIAGEVTTLSRYEEALDEAEAAVTTRRAAAVKQAASLSKARLKVAKRLGRAVTAELADLEFGKAVFEVSVEASPNGLSASGGDRVSFLVALNPGEGAHPLKRVASGGELSRLMLAIKRALAGVGPVGTYVFDEVDAGVGGATAAAVGAKLREVAGHHQVVCITHLPQIAGLADTHFVVSKAARSGRTATRLSRLDEPSRVEELARMLGGAEVTDKTREAARELRRP